MQKWIPQNDGQRVFLSDARHIRWTAPRGAGKTAALVAAALRDIDLPGYRAVLIDGTAQTVADELRKQLSAIDPRARESAPKRWLFSSGATLWLAPNDEPKRLRGCSFHFVGINEIDEVSSETIDLARFTLRDGPQELMRWRATATGLNHWNIGEEV